MPKESTMAISIFDDDTIEAARGNKPDVTIEQLTEQQFQNEIRNKKVKKVETVMVVTTNPCTYVNIGGTWVKVCW